MSTRIQFVLATSLVVLSFTLSCAFAGTVRYSYDAAGRLTTADYGVASLAYSYDPAGNVLSTTATPTAAPGANIEDLAKAANKRLLDGNVKSPHRDGYFGRAGTAR